jgi:hypothetical protein
VPFNEPLFYDPYLVDYTSDGATLLYPLPVRVAGVSGYERTHFFAFGDDTFVIQ